VAVAVVRLQTGALGLAVLVEQGRVHLTVRKVALEL